MTCSLLIASCKECSVAPQPYNGGFMTARIGGQARHSTYVVPVRDAIAGRPGSILGLNEARLPKEQIILNIGSVSGAGTYTLNGVEHSGTILNRGDSLIGAVTIALWDTSLTEGSFHYSAQRSSSGCKPGREQITVEEGRFRVELATTLFAP